MAASNVNELEGLLSSLNQLKPPGASKTKIAAITQLCVHNIQAESTIVQSFYRALKKAPATHKLGALYVIDSVVRQWIEKAKMSGQELHLEGRGEPGTYPAAVKRVTELMPALFDDIVKGIPDAQKPKLENMIAIWERGSTFPAKLLAEFKSKLGGVPSHQLPTPAAPAPAAVNGTRESSVQQPVRQASPGDKFKAPVPSRPVYTPVGMPPRHLYDQGLLPGRNPPVQANGSHAMPQQQSSIPTQAPTQLPPQMANAPAADVNSILAALSKAAVATPLPQAAPNGGPPQQAPAPPPPQALPAGFPPQLAALFSQQQASQSATPQHSQPNPYAYPAPSVPPMPTPLYQAPPPYASYVPQPPPSIPQAYPLAAPPAPPVQQPPSSADPLAQLRGFLPENILNDREKLIPALQLLQDLQKDGIPPDRWGPVLKAFEEQYQPAAPTYESHAGQARGRGRSRSPDRGGRGGRGSPVYGAYDANARNQSEENRDPRGGHLRSRYRQRSPIRNSPPIAAMNGKPMQPKYIDHDGALLPDHIKVLSRTLFVGGANGTQQEIHDLFERFGRVQTCIANRDKRHAFVKMTTRQHALAAKDAMEDMQSRNDRETMNIARQTKWGVGFGPRECCDYNRGESVIPIHKLTEADLKWLHTAEYGGTGGRKLEGGMVLEEPDIEIGAGVSSKAMSKRIGPESSAPTGKRQREEREGGGGGGGGGGGRHRKHKGGDHGYGAAAGASGGYSGVSGGPHSSVPDPYGFARPEPVAVATPPAVPGFGFNLGVPGSGGGGAANPYH